LNCCKGATGPPDERVSPGTKKNAEGPATFRVLASKALISTAQRILLTRKIRDIQYGLFQIIDRRAKDSLARQADRTPASVLVRTNPAAVHLYDLERYIVFWDGTTIG